MSGGEWIVCESSNRWAAGLRLALAQQTRVGGPQYRLREVRSLAELAVSLSERPASLTCVEVRRTNLGDVLTWLSEAVRAFDESRFVVLLDGSLQADPWTIDHETSSLGDVYDALREAGAVEVVTSPRRLGSVVGVGLRYANSQRPRHTQNDVEQSITSNAWASLPWQAG